MASMLNALKPPASARSAAAFRIAAFCSGKCQDDSQRMTDAVTLGRMDTTELLSAIDSEIATLQQARALLAGQYGHSSRTVKPAKKPSTMSAAVRARIGAATKARWAAGKMGKQSQSRTRKAEAGPAKKKHTMSAAGRARIAAAQKARWAKLKAAKKAA